MPKVLNAKLIRGGDQLSRHWVDRTTKWGNQFIIGRDGDRAMVIRKHREWLPNQAELMACLAELRGKNLVCWCAPLACHGDFLLELANK